MPRIHPIDTAEAPSAIQVSFARHVQTYGSRITNMKATLGHSLVAFEIYMQWYPLYEEVRRILGHRLAGLFAFSISQASNSPLCSTYFRKIIIEKGEDPENLILTEREKNLLDLGAAIADNKGIVPDEIYNRVSFNYTRRDIVLLIAFAGQMIATNSFNNVIKTDIDEYLNEFVPVSIQAMAHE
jgi:hypothetical protein